jgi:integrase
VRGERPSDHGVLQAALRYWHAEHHPIIIPKVVKPKRQPPRQRWLTKHEAARLLYWAHRLGHRHLARFILLGPGTGSRATVMCTWDQIDLHAGIMHGGAPGVAEDERKRMHQSPD